MIPYLTTRASNQQNDPPPATAHLAEHRERLKAEPSGSGRMNKAAKVEVATESAAKQLSGFLAKYDPAISKLATAARSLLRKRMPTAVELVYENYNALAIAFGPNELASDVIVSVDLHPRWVSLMFIQGSKLPDPERLLRGSGSQARHIRLDDAADLESAAILAIIAEAIRSAPVPLPEKGKGTTVIKTVSKTQRSRRPSSDDPDD